MQRAFSNITFYYRFCYCSKFVFIQKFWERKIVKPLSVNWLAWTFINSLVPSVLNIGRLSKILISFYEGILKKISYERRWKFNEEITSS